MRIVRVLLIAGIMSVQGCGHSNCATLGKVSGTACYRGKPIAAGSLVFEVAGARPARAKIVGGKIDEVTTYEPNDGVPVGLARIAVFATQPIAPPKTAAVPKKPATPQEALAGGMDHAESAKSLIPARYNDPGTSGLTSEIAAGQNHLTLDLQ